MIMSTIRCGCSWNIRYKFLPAKALKLLENVLELKLKKLQKIVLKLVTTEVIVSTIIHLIRENGGDHT